MTTYMVVRLGAKFPGECVKCGSTAEGADAMLLKDAEGAYRVGHPRCFGLRTKHKVGGGIDWRGEAPRTVEVSHG